MQNNHGMRPRRRTVSTSFRPTDLGIFGPTKSTSGRKFLEELRRQNVGGNVSENELGQNNQTYSSLEDLYRTGDMTLFSSNLPSDDLRQDGKFNATIPTACKERWY